MLKTFFTSQVSFLVAFQLISLPPAPPPIARCMRLLRAFPRLDGTHLLITSLGLGISPVPSSFPFVIPIAHFSDDRCSLDTRFLPFISPPFPSNLLHGVEDRLFRTCRHLPFSFSSRSFVTSIQPTYTAAIFSRSHFSPSSALSSSSVPSLLISLHPLSWFSHVTSVCDLTGLFF